FSAVNCGELSEPLLASELFGHRKGAFTGADQDKKGLFEIADGGTLFLDEIGEMSLALQGKLLCVLQEGRVRRGAFRQDLYYRLKVFPIRLPPLRERRDDIPILVEHFLRKYTQEMK